MRYSSIENPKAWEVQPNDVNSDATIQFLAQYLFRLEPLGMYRRWRPVISDFRAEERLYRRHRREDIVDGVILPSALPFPKKEENTGQSVNRSAYSRPEDALWSPTKRLDGMGVFEFPVSCRKQELTCPNTARCFTFRAQACAPRKKLLSFGGLVRRTPWRNTGYVLPTKLARKELRATIQKNSRIVIRAEV